METFGERLARARLARRMERKELAQIAGVSLSYLSALESGAKTNPSVATARSLAAALKVNYTWLLTGEGDMEGYGRTSLQAVPIVGHVPAGEPLRPDEVMVGLAWVPRELERQRPDFALIVAGDSMIDSEIAPGDVILIRKQETADDGQIVVAQLPDPQTGEVQVTLKRWKRGPGYALLQPGNHQYQPLAVSDVRVIGRYVGKAALQEVEVL